MTRRNNMTVLQTTFRRTTTVLASLTSSRRVRKETTTLGTLTMGFKMARSKKRLHLMSPQNSLLYLHPLQVM
jgi:hypothetical protein